MKAFGRDTGRNTEGRRNHIDSYKYVADDGSKRTRVRFNIKGNKGQVHVWVEVRTLWCFMCAHFDGVACSLNRCQKTWRTTSSCILSARMRAQAEC